MYRRRLAALAVLFWIYPHVGGAQQSWIEAAPPDLQSQETQVTAEVECSAYSFLANPYVLGFIDLRIHVDSVLVQADYQTGYYTIGAGPVSSGDAVIDRQDRLIRCTAQFVDEFKVVDVPLPRRYPTALLSWGDSWTYKEWGRYELVRTWQVKDNYSANYTYSGTPVTERWDVLSNGCGFDEIRPGAGTILNGAGQFPDQYSTFGNMIPECIGTTTNCVTEARQTIYVENWSFSHPVDWRCDGVTIYR
jgi:hypothetical protein